MNQAEFTKWINRATMLFDDVRRFVDGRSHQQRDLLEEWFALLAETSYADADKVLSLLLSGEIQRPEYFDVGRLAGLVVREARALASNRTKRLQYGNEQSYHCATCRDTGLVNAWNPRFVESYRDEFARVAREAIDRDAPREARIGRLRIDLDKYDPERTITVYRYAPATWLADAARWWRGLKDGNSTIHHIVRCPCGGERSQTLLAEREKFVRHERRFGTKELGMPACGMADYNPPVMPLKTDEPYRDLADWYAKHEVNAVYEWTPNPDDYARF